MKLKFLAYISNSNTMLNRFSQSPINYAILCKDLFQMAKVLFGLVCESKACYKIWILNNTVEPV